MNQTLFKLCRQQSLCYHLIPPPQIPAFIFINSSSTLINHHQPIDLLFIILCVVLLSFALKFQIYHKLRDYYHHHMKCNRSESIDQSNIISTPLNIQSTSYYYSSKIICQNCLLDSLHHKHQCLCHHFFLSIK